MDLPKELSDERKDKSCCGSVSKFTLFLGVLFTVVSLVIAYIMVSGFFPLIGSNVRSSSSSNSERLSQGESCYDYNNHKCADGLTCNPSTRICECQENGEQKCLAKFDQTCHTLGVTAPRCDPQDALFCSWGQCVCRKGAMYNHKEKRCLLQVNEPCQSNNHRHNNGSSGLIVVEEVPCDTNNFLVCHDMSSNSNYSGHRCQCKGGMKLNMDGQCRVSLGDPCNDNELPCMGTPTGAVGTWYNMDDANRPVVCSKTTGRCECKPGLVETRWGECGIPLDGPCDLRKDFCDRSRFLRCDDQKGVCQCKYETVRNVDGTCVLSSDYAGRGEWSGCSNSGSAPGCDPRKFLLCEESSKKCRCRNGFVMTNEGCRALFGEICGGKDDITCDEENFLVCGKVSGRCECSEGLVSDGNGFCEASRNRSGSDHERFYFNLILKRMLKDRMDYLRNSTSSLKRFE